MTWLYEHRDRLDGLRPLVEIAHWVMMYRVPFEDEDDVEQDIIVTLLKAQDNMLLGRRYSDLQQLKVDYERYLWKTARNIVYGYLRKRQQKQQKLCHLLESDKGERAEGTWQFVHVHDGDNAARLDAKAILASLPKRLIEIGYKLLNDEKLTEADQSYLRRQRAKLNCRKHGNHLSDYEKRRILQLHSEGVSMSKIARTMGRSNKAVMRVLADTKLSRQEWLDAMRTAAKERDKRIQSAFLEGKSIPQIARELHVGIETARNAVRGLKR